MRHFDHPSAPQPGRQLQLILVRGLPGSGKSTLAKSLVGQSPWWRHVEADHFHEVEGQYQFEPALVEDSHIWCKGQVAFYLRRGLSVVVSNTFVRLWEIQPYLDLARRYGALVQILECKGGFGSIHNVPAQVVDAMAAKWEELPPSLGGRHAV